MTSVGYPTETLAYNPTASVDETPNPINTPTVAFSPTSDNRLPPEKWKDWPVVPSVSARAQQIYAAGLIAGNNPHSFSKIGDCQSISNVLLGIYDQPDRYALPTGYEYLAETINNFAGSFNRDGYAVKGGYNAAAVLSPLRADPDYCLAGENPVECEIRIHKPTMAIISLEVWFNGRTIDSYKGYMREIIDYAIAKGVVPILATKADNVEGDHSINFATAQLAYEYDIPLWNFWKAVQTIPDHGIDPARDGFHITVEAWDVRSFTALRAIDAVWRESRDSVFISSTVEATKTRIPTQGATPVIAPLPLGMDDAISQFKLQGMIYIGVQQKIGEVIYPQGIYSIDFARKVFSQNMSNEYMLQGVSPDGKSFLLNEGKNLSLFDDMFAKVQQITSDFFTLGRIGAYWSSDNRTITFLEESGGKNQIIRRNFDTGDLHIFDNLPAIPIDLIPNDHDSEIWWESGNCDSWLICSFGGIWSTDAGTGDHHEWSNISQPVFWNGGNEFAFYPIPPAESLQIALSTRDHAVLRYVVIPGDHLIGYSWSPDSRTLAIMTMTRSNYFGKATAIRVFLLNSDTLQTQELESFTGMNPALSWSPDGSNILIAATDDLQNNSYAIQFHFYSLSTKRMLSYGDHFGLTYNYFPAVYSLLWR